MGIGGAIRTGPPAFPCVGGLYASLTAAASNANRKLMRPTSHLGRSAAAQSRKGGMETGMSILKLLRRIGEVLRRIDARCTEATEMHGRYCVGDAKIRAGHVAVVRKDHTLRRDGMVGAQGLEPWTR